MKLTIKLLVLFLFIFLIDNNAFSQKTLTDTIFFNDLWQICLKPGASYYRIGAISADSLWFYTGKIRDYYMNGQLEMEGEYSKEGYKDGPFVFYDSSGNVLAKGKFRFDSPKGDWIYNSGDKKYNLYYPLSGYSFIVLNYTDSSGKNLAKDGHGKFEIDLLDLYNGTPYLLEGNFEDSLRDGTWKYYAKNLDNEYKIRFRETYKRGVFKRAESIFMYGSSAYSEPKMTCLPLFKKLFTTESFKADETFRMDNNESFAVADYLINKNLPGINAQATSFEESFKVILFKLNGDAYRYDYKNRNYNGKIVFFLSDSGYLQNIEITGDLTETEKDHLMSVMEKFKNVHEMMVGNVGIDGWHTIYFYTIDLSFYVPITWQRFFGRHMIFSFLKKEELVILFQAGVKEAQKKMK